jgi:hypothetical protein
MFNDTKYTRWYFLIIAQAKNRNHESLGQIEWHHVIPESLGGKKTDRVALTPREHFVCHLLLVKMLDGTHKRKMAWALHRMMYSENKWQSRYRPCSHTYAHFRKQFYDEVRGKKRILTAEHRANIALANKKRLSGKTLSPEWCSNLSKSHMGEANGMFGKTHTAESIVKMSENRKGKGSENISKALTGRKMTCQAKANLSISLRANPRKQSAEERQQRSDTMKAVWAAKKANRG